MSSLNALRELTQMNIVVPEVVRQSSPYSRPHLSTRGIGLSLT